MKRALCPGTFDPVTFGHLDIIARAAQLFDEVIVGVGTNSTKNPLLRADERLELMVEATRDLGNVRVLALSGLLVDFCREHECGVVAKGLRFAADFDYEAQMAQLNHALSGIETVMLPTSAQWGFVSSTMIREIALLGGDISPFVPDAVQAAVSAAVDARKAGQR